MKAEKQKMVPPQVYSAWQRLSQIDNDAVADAEGLVRYKYGFPRRVLRMKY